MIELFSDMGHYNEMINRHCEGSALTPNKAKMAVHRNLIQYRLLSLPVREELAERGSASSKVYELCRLAAMIFSFGVIFPMPSDTPRLSLVKRLRYCLEMGDDKAIPSHANDFLLWVLVIGGMAADRTPDAPWYIRRLAQLGKRLNLPSWRAAKKMIESYLWLDRACDHGGIQLWVKVINTIGGSMMSDEDCA